MQGIERDSPMYSVLKRKGKFHKLTIQRSDLGPTFPADDTDDPSASEAAPGDRGDLMGSSTLSDGDGARSAVEEESLLPSSPSASSKLGFSRPRSIGESLSSRVSSASLLPLVEKVIVFLKSVSL